ncbi:Acetylornithine deacetylase/succinyldiaminopimelate desuccinylase-like deacylase [Mesorhizobium plurifarium]|uniref:Acetylornithine deacetylase/succinyldiaminopimelate desuccinylase-like deacylase n=1 Tax=Mesorhizobium plurifarium TaxID=69974 RepID=A0A090FZ37_MESPL|nr:Acetylornithine deacetylase/succinyldiaminopimelate desuccinylase-like deacylase [Mesorhizobium plurifarium]
MTGIKKEILANISRREAEMVEFLRSLIQARTPNPPGDTTAAMELVARFLSARNISYEIVEPNPGMPNLIAKFTGAGEGPKLVLNGHLDVFPAGDLDQWSHDPWAANEVDGCIYGRGACDMKSGTTALLFAFAELFEIRNHLKGSVVLTVVSDEETFGPWGARYLVEHRKDVLGDCLLSGEPTSPHALRFGEKGRLWIRIHVRTPGAHGAYVHMSRNPITIASDLIASLHALEDIRSPAETPLTLTLGKSAATIDRAYGNGAADIISSTTLNVGAIKGGLRINIVPSDCVFDIDVRTPPDVPHTAVMERFKEIIAAYPEASFEVLDQDAASTSPPDHPMVRALIHNSKELSGIEPAPIIALGGCDARLWRYAGIPAFVYGPSPTGMGTANELVRVDEFLHVAKTHTLAAFDYLSGDRNSTSQGN